MPRQYVSDDKAMALKDGYITSYSIENAMAIVAQSILPDAETAIKHKEMEIMTSNLPYYVYKVTIFIERVD